MYSRANTFVFICLLLALLAVTFNFLEAINYPNYVYTRFHVSPAQINVFFAVVGSLFIFLYTIKTDHSIMQALLITMCGFLVINQTPHILGTALSHSVVGVQNWFRVQNEQYSVVWGEKIYFFNFVKSQLPSGGSLLIPPDELPWRYSGSTQFMMSWMYPTRVYSAREKYYLTHLSDLDAVVISSEEDGRPMHTWPDFEITGKKIIIYDWQTRSGITQKTSHWNPEDWRGKKPWGIILLK